MSPIPGIRRLFRLEHGAADVERDVREELQFHIERAIEELIAAGYSPDEARREAESRFGDLRALPARLEAIDRRRMQREQRAEWWESLWQDIRFARRSLARAPSFTIAAVLTLGIGMGANTAIFSAVNGVLLRPAPFERLDRVAMIWETDRASGTTREPASIPDYRDFRDRARSFERMAAFAPVEITMSPDRADPERVAALAVSHDWFGTIGARPLAGRSFTAEEDAAGGPRAVMISEDLWERVFQRDPGITGRTLRLNNVTWDVVGVMPRGSDFGILQLLGAAAYQRGFADRGGRARVDLWLPLRASSSASRGNHPIFVTGRLAPGASAASAQQEMTAIAADLERQYPAENAERGAFVEPVEAVVFGNVRQALFVLLGAVAMVLLVACANVANLQLVRATARTREAIVRTALGASAPRLAQQFLVESAMLAAAGAAVGVAVAYGAVGVLRAMAPATIPRAESMTVDASALVLTGAVAAVIALVVGLLPTLRARRLDISQSLHEEGGRGSAGGGGRARRSVRSALVIAELAMATTLMTGAGLLVRSLWQLQNVDPGFEAKGVLKAEFELPSSRYPTNFAEFPSWPERFRFQNELVARLSALPGVESAALASANPMAAGFTSSITVVGRESEGNDWPEPAIRQVGESYFGTMRVPLIDGRYFVASDGPTAPPVVIINAAARDVYFGGREPLGAQVNLWGASRTVVGVISNERFRGLASSAAPAVYMPLEQAPFPGVVVVRMSGDAAAAAPLVRRVIRDIDPQLAVFGVESLEETISGTLAQRRYTMLVLLAFAIAALALAGVGVHGVLSYAVAQRTREIGVRVALGADAGRVQGYVLRDGARLIAIGLALGITAALALAQAMRALVFGVTTRDPATLLGVVVVLGAVALLASWLPARRASRVDPMIALRSD